MKKATLPPMESVETLLRYRRKGIPLMPHQKEYLLQHGHLPEVESSHLINNA